jgi:hypothetical protein
MQRTFLTAHWMLICSALAGCPDDDGDGARDSSIEQPTDATGRDGGIDGGPGQPSQAGLVPWDCKIVAPTACPEVAPKYVDVQPIFTKQCGVCHGQAWTGEWPLDNYSHISDWQDEIRSELSTCSMPPADGGVNVSLDDRMKILNWIRCGLPK